MRKTAVLAAMTVLVLSGGSTYAFAAGSDDGPNHDQAVASFVSAGDDHRGRSAEAGDDRGAHQARHHARHHARHRARHHRHTAHHARHRHVEAGDDHGRHGGEAERGDDHGGRHGGHGSDD